MPNNEKHYIQAIIIIVIFAIVLFFKLRKKPIVKYENTDYENMLSVRTILILVAGIILLLVTLID